MYRVVAWIAAAAAWAGLSAVSIAASGTALGVNPAAQDVSKADTRVLTVGADIFIGDRVVTDTKGLVQIKFNDDTKLVVGPNSSLVIEDYLLRNDNSPGKFAVNILSGTFRFVTGNAPKDRYQIDTPSGTIGVRGTAGDGHVGPDGTWIMIYHGAMILCDYAHPRNCVTVDEMCQVGQITGSDAELIGNAQESTGEDRTALKQKFPWATNESHLLHAFWVANARDCLNRPIVLPKPALPVGNHDPNSCGDSEYSDGQGHCYPRSEDY